MSHLAETLEAVVKQASKMDGGYTEECLSSSSEKDQTEGLTHAHLALLFY